MSSRCSIVKGINILLALLGVAAIVVGAIMYFGASAVDLEVEDGVKMAQIAAIIMAVMGVVELVAGICGVVGSGNPARLMPFIVLGAVVGCANVAEIVVNLVMGGGSVWLNVVYAAAVFTAVFHAVQARKEAAK